MSELPQRRIADLPWQRQALFYGVVTAVVVALVFVFAFFQVTLRQAFELENPWHTFGAFVGTLVAMSLFIRGLYRVF